MRKNVQTRFDRKSPIKKTARTRNAEAKTSAIPPHKKGAFAIVKNEGPPGKS
jgi:hypothetical protein